MHMVDDASLSDNGHFGRSAIGHCVEPTWRTAWKTRGASEDLFGAMRLADLSVTVRQESAPPFGLESRLSAAISQPHVLEDVLTFGLCRIMLLLSA